MNGNSFQKKHNSEDIKHNKEYRNYWTTRHIVSVFCRSHRHNKLPPSSFQPNKNAYFEVVELFYLTKFLFNFEAIFHAHAQFIISFEQEEHKWTSKTKPVWKTRPCGQHTWWVSERYRVQISKRRSNIPQVYCDFPQILQVNARIVHRSTMETVSSPRLQQLNTPSPFSSAPPYPLN